MTTAQINFVTRVIALAVLLFDEYGEVSALNALWYGAADYNGQIDQAALDEVASFTGLTPAYVEEIMYVIGGIKGLIDPRLEPFAVVTAASIS